MLGGYGDAGEHCTSTTPIISTHPERSRTQRSSYAGSGSSKSRSAPARPMRTLRASAPTSSTCAFRGSTSTRRRTFTTTTFGLTIQVSEDMGKVTRLGVPGGLNIYADVGSKPLPRMAPTGELLFIPLAMAGAVTARHSMSG